MQNRHTTQIRQLLQKKHLSKSRFNPQSRVVVNSTSMKQSRQLKKSSSSLHLDKQKQLELQIMQKRYQQLYFEYEKMVEQSIKKAEMCKRQQDEINKYEKAGQRDKKQIQRLQSMIGMIHKKQNGVQTIEDKTNFNQQYNFLDSFGLDKKAYRLEQSHSDKKLQTQNSNKKYKITSQNDQNYKFNIPNKPMNNSTLLNRSKQSFEKNSSGLKIETKNKVSGQQLSEKEIMKRLGYTKTNEVTKLNNHYSKMAESMLYGNKSSIDFRRKKNHLYKGSSIVDNAQEHNKQSQVICNNLSGNIKNSRINSGNLRVNSPNSRVNSPNSRFKFVPSVDI